MLTTLQISDYALIKELTIEFKDGLNIITGETGAGKSILIGALGLLLGERASLESVRNGAKKSVIEGIFEVEKSSPVNDILRGNEIEIQPELIVRREVSLKGSNRCFLNDTPVPLSVIKDIGNNLVDLHGQHEHQSLLKTENHLLLLDASGDIRPQLKNYLSDKTRLSKALRELNDLRGRENSIREKRDLFDFQIQEIDAISPMPGEEEELEAELKILENSEKLLESTTGIYTLLYDGENTIYDNLVTVRDMLQDLAGIDVAFSEKLNEAESALANIDDIAEFTRSYRDKIDLEPVRLEEVRERLGAFNLLKKKYGGTIDAVITYRKEIGAEYDLAENFAGKIEELGKEIEVLRKNCGLSAENLSRKRKQIAENIKPEIEASLKYLGINDPVFEVKFETVTPSEKDEDFVILPDGQKVTYLPGGIDQIEFFISTNPGEEVKPLVKIASGGEISRIMLSLKTILAKNDRLPLLVFDEIDTGVSGRIASKVGSAMKSLAAHHQIIAITHLPQIAASGDHQFVVEKKKSEDRAVSNIRILDKEERVTEIAKLISGEELTDSALGSARELLHMPY
ncbi:MAG: DNA repair protein RecN [Melioribacteraceae bacterium]|nr:MAG: DNA repair protein RecN [Melioribacteraceae bacterium]